MFPPKGRSQGDLTKEYHANSAEILRTERDLNKITEDGMREEVLRMRNFEQLNTEKITPYFLSLAKKPHNSESLLDIRRNDGEAFDNSSERDNYIRSYFADTYKKGPDIVTDQSINHFLGDVAEHPDVLSSKLSPDERDSLERELTIDESDKALNKAKLSSSPGIDTISNRFMKTFWHIFRVPLYEYAKCCYDKGMLTENFRCVKIRLIPKKGTLHF